jgi:agmatine/peptidylarginine deiminase
MLDLQVRQMNKSMHFPAEWEHQDAVLMAWPHEGTDWGARLLAVQHCFAQICSAICARQILLLCIPDEAIAQQARGLLSDAACNLSKLHFVQLPYNDTWLRDSGPITLSSLDNSKKCLLDFHFTAWGGKFEADLDDEIVAQLLRKNVFAETEYRRIDFALEGGGIETDGLGTLLSTWHCLHKRHPDKSRAQISAVLMTELYQERVLWLDYGYLEGDDTDAHIDTLARFASPDSIVYQGCQDTKDKHFTELQQMAAELAQFTQKNGEPYRLFELPWPQPILDHGRRLAASYANFLIINGAVLMPVYDDPVDQAAIAVMRNAFPKHDIIAINCRDLIWQNGSLHCCTMQLPQGLLR